VFRRNPFSGEDPLADFPNVDGVVALTHKSGCGMTEKEPLRLLRRTLAGYARHVNFSHVVVLGLGCEVNQIRGLKEEQHLSDRVRNMDIQLDPLPRDCCPIAAHEGLGEIGKIDQREPRFQQFRGGTVKVSRRLHQAVQPIERRGHRLKSLVQCPTVARGVPQRLFYRLTDRADRPLESVGVVFPGLPQHVRTALHALYHAIKRRRQRRQLGYVCRPGKGSLLRWRQCDAAEAKQPGPDAGKDRGDQQCHENVDRNGDAHFLVRPVRPSLDRTQQTTLTSCDDDSPAAGYPFNGRHGRQNLGTVVQQ